MNCECDSEESRRHFAWNWGMRVSQLGRRRLGVPSDANMRARRVRVFSNVDVDSASDGRRR